MEKGFAGRIAVFHQFKINHFNDCFDDYRVYSSTLIPREEEPQIIIPMADVMVGYPGATKRVESRVVKPLKKLFPILKV
jgi:hypothetical protein